MLLRRPLLVVVLICVCLSSIFSQTCKPRSSDFRNNESVQYTVPAYDVELNSWGYASSSNVPSPVEGNNGVFAVNHVRGNKSKWVLSTLPPLNYLKASTKYSVSLQMRQSATGLNTVRRASFILTSTTFNGPDKFRSNTAIVNVVIPFSSTNDEWHTFTIPFSIRADTYIRQATIHMEVENPRNEVPVRYEFRNVKIGYPETTIPRNEKLITKFSQYLDIPSPSANLDANPRTNCPFDYSNLKKWQDASSWPKKRVPSPNDVIMVPENTQIIIDGCSLQNAVYNHIEIPQSSSLIFSDEDITLKVRSIQVNGTMEIGSPTCRYFSRINIVFYGKKSEVNRSTTYRSKGIVVSSSGRLEVHGKQYHQTWTRLARTAFPGENYVRIQGSVNWEKGQQVALLTSDQTDIWTSTNEVLTIKAVEGNIVQFEERIRFLHFASEEYQVEVALLSRRIVFSGADEDSVADEYGGHVLITGQAKLAGAQFYHMGQKNEMARYPIHYHLSGNQKSTSYVKDCSVSESFYRCLTIHGTHELEVMRTVGYDIFGHCYYIEDAVEENNTLAFNLAGYIKTIGKPATAGTQGGETFFESDQLKNPTDSAAAGFYISNAYNRFIGNTASGGWAGFAFPNVHKPIGLHRHLTGVVPSSRPPLEFKYNTAHSSGHTWVFAACIYVGGILEYRTVSGKEILVYRTGRSDRSTTIRTIENGRPVNNRVPFKLEDIKTFMCNDGISHWGDGAVVERYESHDNHKSFTLFNGWMDKGMITGKSTNPSPIRFARGFQFYDTWSTLYVTNSTFINFQPARGNADNRVIMSMTHSDRFKPQGIAATNNLRFINVPDSQKVMHRALETGGSRYFNFIDYDGSTLHNISGKATIHGSYETWWKADDNCVYKSDWNQWVCEKNNLEIVNVEIRVPNVIGNGLGGDLPVFVGKTCLFSGKSTDNSRCTGVTKNSGIAGLSGAWYFYLDGGSPAEFSVEPTNIPEQTEQLLAVSYPKGTKFNIRGENKFFKQFNRDFTEVSSLSEVRKGDGYLFFFDNNNGVLYIKLVIKSSSKSGFNERGGARLHRQVTGFTITVKATCSNLNKSNQCPVEFRVPQNIDMPQSTRVSYVGAGIAAVLLMTATGVMVNRRRSRSSDKSAEYSKIPEQELSETLLEEQI